MRLAAAGARGSQSVPERNMSQTPERKSGRKSPPAYTVTSMVQSRMHTHRDPRVRRGGSALLIVVGEGLVSTASHRCHRRLQDVCRVREKRHLSGLLLTSVLFNCG